MSPLASWFLIIVIASVITITMMALYADSLKREVTEYKNPW